MGKILVQWKPVREDYEPTWYMLDRECNSTGEAACLIEWLMSEKEDFCVTHCD